MKHNVFLLVPTKDNQGLDVDNTQVLNKVVFTMSSLFGGCTNTTCSGSYLAQNGSIITEAIVKVESYCEDLSKQQDLISLASYVKTELNQECIAICINGELRFI